MAFTYLALGDSYTIGESVSEQENFPHQLVKMLAKESIVFAKPRIIAKTGWTTDELATAIEAEKINQSFDLVTLLIGVNNQYRGRSVEEYAGEFEKLLLQAIQFAGSHAPHVVVVSIPDWGVTPFAAGRDRETIAKEIDQYNFTNKNIALKHHIHYVDITPGSRLAAADNTLLAADGLHPSGKEYAKWAAEILPYVKGLFA